MPPMLQLTLAEPCRAFDTLLCYCTHYFCMHWLQMPRLVEAIRGLGFDAKAHFDDMGWEAASL